MVRISHSGIPSNKIKYLKEIMLEWVPEVNIHKKTEKKDNKTITILYMSQMPTFPSSI